MLWVFAFLLLVLAVPAVLISWNNRNAVMDAMAMHERLQRTDPTDPLAQLGPTEFRREFEKAASRRGRPMLIGLGLGLLAGFFLSFGVGFGLSYMMDDVDLFIPVYGVSFLGFVILGSWIGASKRLSVFDQMRKQLHLD